MSTQLNLKFPLLELINIISIELSFSFLSIFNLILSSSFISNKKLRNPLINLIFFSFLPITNIEK